MNVDDLDSKKKADLVFANDVVILIDLLSEGKFDEVISYESNTGKLEEEKKLAKSLYYIRQLLSSQTHFVSEKERGLNMQAANLLEAILANKHHAVWRFVDGQKAMQRGVRRPTTSVQLSRALALALVQVLREEGSTRPFHDAAVLLNEEFDLGFTADQMRSWGKVRAPRFDEMVASHVAAISKRSGEDGLTRRAIALLWVGVQINAGTWNTRG